MKNTRTKKNGEKALTTRRSGKKVPMKEDGKKGFIERIMEKVSGKPGRGRV